MTFDEFIADMSSKGYEFKGFELSIMSMAYTAGFTEGMKQLFCLMKNIPQQERAK